MAPVLKGHERFWGTIAVFGDYLPWNVHVANGGDRGNYPPHSGRILDLKEEKQSAVRHFADMLRPEFPDNISIVTVPSHNPAKPGKGLQMLAAALASKGKRIEDASCCLVRSMKIDKLAHGGDRSKEVHLKSITVDNRKLIRGRDVLLLDDVTKTGNSLAACKELLIKAGARSVLCATIGKT